MTALKTAPAVHVLTPQDAKKAALTLHRSFEHDALARYLTKHIPDPKDKQAFNCLMYECYLKQHIDKGLCLGIGEGETCFETVAIWSTPTSFDRGLETFHDYMEHGFDKFWTLAGAEGREKVFKGLLPLLDRTSERIVSDPRFADCGVFTLVYLGSVAEARGKGNVRAMFDYMFGTHIDAGERNIAYLESSAPSNIPIYNKFGFHVYEQIVLGENGVEGENYAAMNVMVRAPHGADWQTP